MDENQPKGFLRSETVSNVSYYYCYSTTKGELSTTNFQAKIYLRPMYCFISFYFTNLSDFLGAVQSSIKDVRSQGGGGLSSADIREGYFRRTSALFGAKNFGFSKFMVCLHRGG